MRERIISTLNSGMILAPRKMRAMLVGLSALMTRAIIVASVTGERAMSVEPGRLVRITSRNGV